jgi:hypothetical protein
MMTRVEFVSLLLVSVASGCIASSEGTGVRHDTEVSVLQQTIDPTQRIELDEEFRLGTLDEEGPEQFYLVRAAVLVEDGSLFVLDRGNHRVLRFDDSGEFVAEFGREGQGPGEFLDPVALSVWRDTVVVAEAQANRVHSFLTDGSHIATRVLRGEGEARSATNAVGTRDGWLVGMAAFFHQEETRRDPSLRVRLHAFSPVEGLTQEPLGLEWSWADEGQWVNDFFWIRPIFAHRPVWAIDGLGRVHTAETGAYRISTYSSGGALLRNVENEVERAPVTEELIDQWRESRDCPPGLEGLECSRENDRVALSMPTPQFRPVIGHLVAFESGHLAVLRGDLDPHPFTPGDVSVWEFFDPDGRYLGRLEQALSVFWFDGEALVAWERDALGVEYVVRYRVVGG